MSAKHTPGPWKLEEGGLRVLANPPGFRPTKNSPHFVVANSVYLSAEYDSEEMKANQRLIAAAPDLLESLEELLAAYWQALLRIKLAPGYNFDEDPRVIKARAAIAEAKGGA